MNEKSDDAARFKMICGNLKIRQSPHNKNEIEVSWRGKDVLSDKHLGEFVMGDDGYFGFFPRPLGGMWSQELMRSIASAMERLNKDWDETVAREIGGKNAESE